MRRIFFVFLVFLPGIMFSQANNGLQKKDLLCTWKIKAIKSAEIDSTQSLPDALVLNDDNTFKYTLKGKDYSTGTWKIANDKNIEFLYSDSKEKQLVEVTLTGINLKFKMAEGNSEIIFSKE